ncbi:MAG TPA: PAS domain S-box protein [Calditrichia bacterium]|nr:PAS domain S-box protein [Calditrichia bacterium]
MATLGGLVRFDPESGDFRVRPANPENPAELASDLLVDAMMDPWGRVWLASYDSGVELLDPLTGKIEHLRNNIANPKSLTADGIRSLYQDSHGNIWLGTGGGGVNKFSPVKQKFLHLRKDLTKSDFLSDNKIVGINIDGDDYLMVGTYNGGLNLSRVPPYGQGYPFRCFSTQAERPEERLSSNSVGGAVRDDRGQIWVSTLDGLNKLVFEDPDRPLESPYRVEVFRPDPKNPFSLIHQRVTRVALTPSGLLLVGTYRGLSLYDPRTGRFHNYTTSREDDGLQNQSIQSILVESDSVVWLGSMEGFQKMHLRVDETGDPQATFQNYQSVPGVPTSINRSIITAITPLKGGELAIGTHDDGLYFFNPEKNSFYPLNNNLALPGLTINGVLADSAEELWIATNRGLAHLPADSSEFRVYDSNDGLQSNEFNASAFAISRDGTMFFGGINGITVFNPGNLPVNRTPPRVMITGLQRLDEALQLDKQVSEIDRIVLEPDQNFLTFEFAALDYTAPAKNEYAYRLEGVDKGWVRPKDRRSATYTDLDPGTYRFRVRATNNDGLWSEQDAVLTITIKPPFWGTWWFRSLIVLALVYLIWRGVSYWLRRVQIYQERLEKKVWDRTQQLVREKEKVQKINDELEELSLVASATSNAVLISDGDGVVQWVNQAFRDLFGYDLEGLHQNGRNTLEDAHPHPELANIVRRVRESGEPMVFEGRVPTRFGSEIWISSTLSPIVDQHSGHIRKIVVVDTDITAMKNVEAEREAGRAELERRVAERTGELSEMVSMLYQQIRERKGAEQELAAQKERLMVTLGAIADGVISTDLDGNVILVNRAAEKLLGLRHVQLAGRPIEMVFMTREEEGRQMLTNPVTRVLETGNIYRPAEPCVLLLENNEERLITNNSAPIYDYNGDLIGAVLIFQDVSEKRRLEEERIRVSKLESLSLLAESVAHDFNNLLTGIQGNAEFAGLFAEKNTQMETYLSTILRACFQAQALTKQLQTYARGSKPFKTVVNIGALVQQSMKLFLTGSKVRGELQLSEDLWNTEADSGEISQVFNNLVVNATQAMHQGGVLAVYGENVVLENQSFLPDGRYLRLTFRDQGIGIPPENLGKIFDPHFTTKRKGSGLGLATSYTIVKNHDGAIDVTSEVGKGTTFVIHLPATNKEIVQDEIIPENLEPGNGRILVMEDDDDVRNVLRDILDGSGYRVDLAEHGEQALAIFDDAHRVKDPFSAVIMDLTIPGGMGGLELMGKLRDRKPDVKTILISGHSTDRLIGEFGEAGFNGFITKPFQVEVIKKVLTLVLNESNGGLNINGQRFSRGKRRSPEEGENGLPHLPL